MFKSNIGRIGKKILLLFCILAQDVSQGQVIRDVFYREDAGDSISVYYYLSPTAYYRTYYVELLFSTDGGTTFFKPDPVSGDIGFVSGEGWKTIEWDTRADTVWFECDTNCIARISIGESSRRADIVKTALFGSHRARETLNGLILFFGPGRIHFENPYFEDALESDAFGFRIGLDFGVRYVRSPFFAEFNFTFENYPPGDMSLVDTVTFAGVNFSAAWIILPELRYIVPYVGLGKQYSRLEGYDWYGDKDRANTSSWYRSLGVQLSVNRFRFWIERRYSLGAGGRKWRGTYFNLGFDLTGLIRRSMYPFGGAN